MEFTKENVLKILNDLETTIRQVGEKREQESKEDPRPIRDWKEGLALGFTESANFIKDTIHLIKEYLITTEDHIDKETKNEFI